MAILLQKHTESEYSMTSRACQELMLQGEGQESSWPGGGPSSRCSVNVLIVTTIIMQLAVYSDIPGPLKYFWGQTTFAKW